MVLGIDLGTCNTLASTIARDGLPVLIPDPMNKDNNLTPSLLLIEKKMALVGSMADWYMDLYPDKNFIRYYKRNFGTQQPVFFDEFGNSWFSETIAAVMLKKIKFDAEMMMPEHVESTVITVPAHYNDAQRKSVIEAAKLADISLSSLIDEPVAAAISNIHRSDQGEDIVMVYDFGGGTFDLTLITKIKNQVHVLAKDGISNLGGKEFDEIIAQKIIEDYKKCFNEDLYLDLTTSNQLRKSSELIKLNLCSIKDSYYCKWLTFSRNAFEFSIDKKDFSVKAINLISKTEEVINRCLRSIGISFSDVNKIILVGGTSKIPFIKEYWQKKIDTAKQEIVFYDPLNAVALGAGVYAASFIQSSGNIRKPLELKSVSSYNIAIKIKDDPKSQNDILIYKNSPLPITGKRIIRILQGQIINLQLVQYWDTSEVFPVGIIKIGPYSDLHNWNIELSVENRSNGTIGLKVRNVDSHRDLPFEFFKEESKYKYNFKEQKKLIDSVTINNIY
jgi:molecular chaperone DnaK